MAKNIFSSFNAVMKGISKLKSYLYSEYQCFIPKCKARCCINAPLPEGFLEQNRPAVQRHIYSSCHMGKNAPWDAYDSAIHNTSPIQVIGFDEKGEMIHGIPKEMLSEFDIKTNEDLKAFLKSQNTVLNYCPFITEFYSCAVYPQRPPICHEFGSLPGKINYCRDKANRMDIIKFVLKNFSFKLFFKNLFS